MKMTLAENIRRFRKERSLTQEQLSRLVLPLGGLTSQDYAAMRAKSIDLEKANEEAAPDDPIPYEHTDTTHFSVADADGNCVPAPDIATAYDAVAAVVAWRESSTIQGKLKKVFRNIIRK